jgi:hypothetical protein
MTRRQLAWVLILIVDVGLVAWGVMAAALPDFLLGPGGKPILPAGYEGFTGGSGRSDSDDRTQRSPSLRPDTER